MHPEGLGPFYNTIKAAQYCGYSADYFRKMAKKYNLKRCGPDGTRYARADLDEWMLNPDKLGPGMTTKQRKPIKLEV